MKLCWGENIFRFRHPRYFVLICDYGINAMFRFKTTVTICTFTFTDISMCTHEHLHPMLINRLHDIKRFLPNFITVLYHTSICNSPYKRWVLDVVMYGLAIGSSRLSYYHKPAHRRSLRICCVILPITLMSCLTSIADFVLTASPNLVK